MLVVAEFDLQPGHFHVACRPVGLFRDANLQIPKSLNVHTAMAVQASTRQSCFWQVRRNTDREIGITQSQAKLSDAYVGGTSRKIGSHQARTDRNRKTRNRKIKPT